MHVSNILVWYYIWIAQMLPKQTKLYSFIVHYYCTIICDVIILLKY